MSENIVITTEQENMIRVCTRDYMDQTNWPNSWITRKRDIISRYKQVKYEQTNNERTYILVSYEEVE